jgi:hypothetical protein
VTSEETLRIRGYLTAQGAKLSPDQIIGKVQEAMAQLRAATPPPRSSASGWTASVTMRPPACPTRWR